LQLHLLGGWNVYEESLMAQEAFAGLPEHRRQHDALTARVGALRGQFGQGRAGIVVKTSHFLKRWLSSHILGTDMGFSQYFVVRGIR
jgi:hemerythrin